MASMRKIELKRIIRDCGRAEREWQLASVGRLTADSDRRPWGTCSRRGFTSAEYLSPAVQHSRTSPLLHSFRWTVNESSDRSHTSEAAPGPLWILAEGRGSGLVREEGFTSAEYLSPAVQHSRTSPLLHSFRLTVDKSSDSSHTSEAAPAPLWILAEGRGSGLVREEGFTSVEYLSPAVQHSRTSPLLHSFRWTVNESSDRSHTSEAAPGPLWILAKGRGSGLVREEGFTSAEYLSPAVQHSRTSPLLHSFRWTVNESSDRSHTSEAAPGPLWILAKGRGSGLVREEGFTSAEYLSPAVQHSRTSPLLHSFRWTVDKSSDRLRTSEASHGPFLHVHARYWLADASRPHGVRTTGR
ncbi:hypothetical protein PSCFBP3800_00564 [Pseudomonas syringae group genomosp. 3]|uniref:Uncharacterized protein n=1 Tax=Pseudomonas syringae group genomosp. 3 TaxID=251701 RepID=A0A2K4W7A1_9PSED|nr:hypothetical protein CFBP6411_00399 [Pseudomonas syringae group genomosp. 3]SPF10635.1 hypothetical protein PSCFBP3800_00564 [Pseudomonas syringae group genomosp. 3]